MNMRHIFILLAASLSALATEVPVNPSPLPTYSTGFLAAAQKGSFWSAGPNYRASFDRHGIHFQRGAGKAHLRFPGGRLRWQMSGPAGPPLHFLGASTSTLSSTTGLIAKNVYPGVDLAISTAGGRMKSEFLLRPGVPVSRARYCLSGATAEVVAAGVALQVTVPASNVGPEADSWSWREDSLVVWQTSSNGERIPLPASFVVDGSCVGFRTATPDPALPITIDPEILFSSFLGGGLFDSVTAVTQDSQGNLYAAGWTESSDFPVLSAYQSTARGRIDAFVAKFNPAGQLQFSTFLTGSAEDRAYGIAVDSQGYIVVAGTSASTNFPSASAYAGYPAGSRDAFVTRLTPAGNQLVFSTYLGGSLHDAALGVVTAPSGVIYVAGETSSSNFPVLSPLYSSSGGGKDAFLARFSATGTLLSSSYLGGAGDDRATAIALGPDGSVFVAGGTSSGNFPVLNASQPARSGSLDAFFLKLNATFGTVLFSSYYGGSGGSSVADESAYGIAVDASSRIYICGATSSTNLPGTGSAYQSVFAGGGTDGFLAVFTAAGALQWSTYLGGTQLDAATSVSLYGTQVAVAGYTASTNFPVINPLQPATGGIFDAFYAIFHTASQIPNTVSYLGGAGSDSALAVSLTNSLVIGGLSLSSNFPLQSAFQSNNPGTYGGFLTRIGVSPSVFTVAPSSGSGAQQTFQFQMQAATPNTPPASATVILNSSLTYASSCAFTYDRTANLFRLYRESDNSWLSIAPGSSGSVSNTNCSLSGTGLGASLSGTRLTLTVPLQFLGSFSGSKQIYLDFSDFSGLSSGWLTIGSWTAGSGPPPSPPAVQSLSPNSGSGTAQTFTLNFTDANGHADISSFSLVINSGFSGYGGCFITFNRTQNRFSLYRDADDTWLNLTPGAGSMSNANCTLTGAGLSVNGSGTTLTVTLPLTFTTAFSGARQFFVHANDAGGLSTNWVQAGSYLVTTGTPPSPPAVQSLSPNSGSGTAQTFSLNFTDANGHADISSFSLVINSGFSGYGGCFITFNRAQNRFSLYRDADDTWLNLTPGAGSASNANCTLSGAGLSVNGSGSTLTVTLPLTFTTAFSGTRQFFVHGNDAGGLATNWVQAGSYLVTTGTPPSPPALQSMSPNAGSGAGQTFTLSITDTNGHSDISSLTLVINNGLNGYNGCFITFNRAQNRFSLYRDADDTWLNLTPGAGSMSNANCTLSGAGLSVNGSGNTLTVTLPLIFTVTFSGPRQFYLHVTDTAGLSTNWVQAGSWNVP